MRLVLADDSILLREGVARLLVEAGFEVVGQAGDAEELLEQVKAHEPDVAIVDIRMPPDTDGGLRAAHEIRARYPTVGVLVLSQYARPSYAFELLSDSAERVGYLLKDRVGDLAELADAVRRVGQGGSVLDPVVVSQLVGRPREDTDALHDLSERERDRQAALHHRAHRREAREEHFHQAQAPREPRRPPPCARGACLPAHVAVVEDLVQPNNARSDGVRFAFGIRVALAPRSRSRSRSRA
jgi:DNA-binding NarL/FixJ family response regulator